MRDLGLLIIRLTAGGLLAGHGSQKLFGWFGGYGVRGTGGWMESLGLRPGSAWATVAGASEFGGGLLTALGLLNPLGPIAMLGPMSIATGKVHWGKPIWVTEGGAELPVTNLAIGVGLALTGPGRYSLDRLLGIRVPRALTVLTAAGVAAGVAVALMAEPSPPPESQQAEEAGAELQAGQGGSSPDPL
ncbi:MAG: DoxX family protein [Chloroflexota bacterium]|nr:DoxX family protein [Chloroflexota bacterium]